MGIFAVPDGIGAPYVHVVADGVGQTQEPLGVRALVVFLLSGLRVLSIHLDELHQWLVLVEICCVRRQATHTSTAQDEVQLVQLPLLRGHKYACCVQQLGCRKS